MRYRIAARRLKKERKRSLCTDLSTKNVDAFLIVASRISTDDLSPEISPFLSGWSRVIVRPQPGPYTGRGARTNDHRGQDPRHPFARLSRRSHICCEGMLKSPGSRLEWTPPRRCSARGARVGITFLLRQSGCKKERLVRRDRLVQSHRCLPVRSAQE